MKLTLKLTLKQKRAIVDRFYAGESMRDIGFDLWTGHFLKLPFGALPSEIVEKTIRWSHKSPTERRRVWRRVTRAGRAKP